MSIEFISNGTGLNFVEIKQNKFDHLSRPHNFNKGRFAMLYTRSDWDCNTRRSKKFCDQFKSMYSKMEIFKDDYAWTTTSWGVHPNSLMYETLENFILELHQHGHLNRLISVYSHRENDHKHIDSGPQILTMHILSAGFIVWIVTVFLSSISFICEHVFNYFFKLRIQRRH
jgi:hypothetical protein